MQALRGTFADFSKVKMSHMKPYFRYDPFSQPSFLFVAPADLKAILQV
jgi:hypothetical protein